MAWKFVIVVALPLERFVDKDDENGKDVNVLTKNTYILNIFVLS
jgi:hypothetical protein